MRDETFWSHFISWSFVPNFYGSQAFVIIGGELIVFYTLPTSASTSLDIKEDIIAQEYLTPCCQKKYFIGHIGMLENRLFMVDGGPNVSSLVNVDFD